MNVLLVGSGGREHALAWRLASSPRLAKLYATPGSAALASLAECVSLESMEAIAEFAASQAIGLTVVGPEPPLVAGLADRLLARGCPVFGPSQAAARLEGSKAFAKGFMQRHGIPTAAYREFESPGPALEYVAGLTPPFVVKADGLAAGKGVVICHDAAAGRTALQRMMEQREFGAAGARVVVEQFLAGEEASFFVISDGEHYVTLPSAQDHKPIGDLDQGPNTGGMGAYCPAPVVDAQVEGRVLSRIVEPTLKGMAAEGHPYRGVLYVGLMIHNGEPAVVEYNCRFGDPECQPQMLLLASDLLDLLEAAANGNVDAVQPRWHAGSAACVVLAAPGYPGPVQQGLPISGLEQWQDDAQRRAFHAGTARVNGQWVTQGGRVLGISARGETLADALARAYRGAEQIHWPGLQMRRDIGLKGLRHMVPWPPGLPGIKVALLAPDAAQGAVLESMCRLLAEWGLPCRQGVVSPATALRPWLRECEEQGAEVCIALAQGDAGWAAQVAAATACPVVATSDRNRVATGNSNKVARGSSNPSAAAGSASLAAQDALPCASSGHPVAWVAGDAIQAVTLAARLLALKYPHVLAALRYDRLRQAAAPGSAGASSSL